jgi:excisionase family DNA binding protein
MALTVLARPLLSVRAVASKLSVSEKTVRRLIESGRLPAVRVGARVRIDQAELEAFVFGATDADD